MSIDAAMVASEDNGNCLKQVLCQNSKIEKISNQKMWLQMWRQVNQKPNVNTIQMCENRLNVCCIFLTLFICFSLGISWISPRLGKKQSESPLVFECLKALTIGLGNGACEQIFTCETNIIQNNKQTKRQKLN